VTPKFPFLAISLLWFAAPASALGVSRAAPVQNGVRAEISETCEPANWVPAAHAKAAKSSRAQCQEARRLLRTAKDLDREFAYCSSAAGACGVAELRGLGQAEQNLESEYFESYVHKYERSLGAASPSLPLFNMLNGSLGRSQRLSRAYIRNGFGALRAVAKRLRAQLDEAEQDSRAGARPRAAAEAKDIDLQGGLALSDFLGVSLLVDDSNAVFPGSDYRAELSRANRLAREFVEIRGRLAALERGLGLPAPLPLSAEDLLRQDQAMRAMLAQKFKPGKAAGSLPADPFRAPPAAANGPAAGAPNFPAGPARAGVPLRAVPAPRIGSLLATAPAPPPSSDLPRAGAHPDAVAGQDLFPRETALIRRQHALRLSYTVGRPREAGRFVHEQLGEDCGIVAQQEVLEMEGRVSAFEPLKTEKALVSAARRQGLIPPSGDGVIPNYLGDLLQAVGVPVVKHYHSFGDNWAPVNAELDAALRRGHVAVVSVDAGVLWNNAFYLDGAHAILVTGVEVSRLSGRIIGYYINDSGDSPALGGRLVSAAQFRQAFDSLAGGSFVEVLQ